MSERVLEEALRAFAAFCLRFTRLARLGGKLVAGVGNGGAADAGDRGDLGERDAGIGLERGDGALALGIAGLACSRGALCPALWGTLRRRPRPGFLPLLPHGSPWLRPRPDGALARGRRFLWLRASQQRREHSGQNLRGGGRLQIEGAEVGEDLGDVGGREHAGSPASLKVGWRTINPPPARCEGDNVVVIAVAREVAMLERVAAKHANRTRCGQPRRSFVLAGPLSSECCPGVAPRLISDRKQRLVSIAYSSSLCDFRNQRALQRLSPGVCGSSGILPPLAMQSWK